MSKEEQDFLTYLNQTNAFSKDTIKNYQYDIDKFYSFINKELVLLEEVDIDTANKFISQEINSGISKSSCLRRISSLKKFYDYLLSIGLINNNPFLFVKKISKESKNSICLTKEEIENLFKLNSLRQDNLLFRDQAIMYLLYSSCLKVSELVDLNIFSVDRRNHIIRVRSKNNKERLVPYEDAAQQFIEKYVTITRPLLLAKNIYHQNNEKSLFLNSQGEKLTSRGIQFILKEIQLTLKLTYKLNPSLLRNSFIKHMLDNGADINFLKDLIGNEDISNFINKIYK